MESGEISQVHLFDEHPVSIPEHALIMDNYFTVYRVKDQIIEVQDPQTSAV
jgi:hypothetical protein